MKRFFVLLVGLMLATLSLSALEPTRISIVTTPDVSTGQTLKVDILESNGSAFDPTPKTIYINDDGTNVTSFPTAAKTDASGRISFILSHSTWTEIVLDATSKNYLVRVTYGSTVICIERIEVVIAKQSLFGATIQADAIDQSGNFTFQKIGILESGSTPIKYSYLQGGDQTVDVTYTLPKTLPTGTGQVLSCSPSGVLSWITPYPTVTIGTQLWMNKNLDVSTYRNGDEIPQVTNSTAWAGLTTGAWCYYNNSSANNATYGKLYNWYAVTDSRGLAPAGWHVPSDAEWTTLSTYLGGYEVAGGKLKEEGTTHWTTPNTGATNETVFSALPGGYRPNDGTFNFIGKNSFWWSSSEYDTIDAWGMGTIFDDLLLNTYASNKKNGYSVRCVRD